MVDDKHKAIKAYKFRIYPNKDQAEKLQWILDRCRELYNAALSERRDAWKYAGKSVTCFDQMNDLPEIKQNIRVEYQEINAQVLQNVLRRLDKAYQNFFRRVKNGDKPGFPRFQGCNRYNSFTYPDKNVRRLQYGSDPCDKKGYLKLAGIGDIRVKVHRKPEGKVKTVTVKREGEHWYVFLACEIEDPEKLPVSHEDIGIDLGVTHLAALSNGEFIDNPRHYRKAEDKLKRLQQSLNHKKKKNDKAGCKGNRRKKTIKAITKAHRKVRNQRRDFAHKASRQLVNRYQMIALEKLQTDNLIKRPKPKQDENGVYLPNGASQKAGLNKSISDAGWGMFTEMLKVKAEWAGRTVVFVNPAYTSQTCSQCGVVRKKELSERWHSCECGCELDRDTNAAINILRLGRSLQGTRP